MPVVEPVMEPAVTEPAVTEPAAMKSAATESAVTKAAAAKTRTEANREPTGVRLRSLANENACEREYGNQK